MRHALPELFKNDHKYSKIMNKYNEIFLCTFPECTKRAKPQLKLYNGLKTPYFTAFDFKFINLYLARAFICRNSSTYGNS